MPTLNNKNDQIKRNGRHSICDFSPKHSLTIHTNSFNHRGKHLHYVTYKSKKLEEKSLANSLSKATRSSINTTGSESSIQTKLIISTDKRTNSLKK